MTEGTRWVLVSMVILVVAVSGSCAGLPSIHGPAGTGSAPVTGPTAKASETGSMAATFSPTTYNVTFTETGLPPKVLAKDGWTVALNGTTHVTTKSVNFTGIPNGVWWVLVTGPSGYTTTGSGAVGVDSPTTISVTIAKGKTAALTFAEKGLEKGTKWCLFLWGARGCSTTASTKFLNLTTGQSYSYVVESPTIGQNITQRVGKAVTYGAVGSISLTKSATVGLTFAYRYGVTFTESGLASGTWSITIKGHRETAAWNVPIEFNLTNGTYGYKIGPEPGYKNSGLPAKVLVSGGPTAATVTFTKK